MNEEKGGRIRIKIRTMRRMTRKGKACGGKLFPCYRILTPRAIYLVLFGLSLHSLQASDPLYALTGRAPPPGPDLV